MEDSDKKPGNLVEFYGTECPHCVIMEPLIERLQKEEGLTIERLEIWHNSKNAALFEKLEPRDEDGERVCGGVPFFINRKTGKWICGSTSYKNLKSWAKGEEFEEE